jgi:hypothetical protein
MKSTCRSAKQMTDDEVEANLEHIGKKRPTKKRV